MNQRPVQIKWKSTRKLHTKLVQVPYPQYTEFSSTFTAPGLTCSRVWKIGFLHDKQFNYSGCIMAEVERSVHQSNCTKALQKWIPKKIGLNLLKLHQALGTAIKMLKNSVFRSFSTSRSHNRRVSMLIRRIKWIIIVHRSHSSVEEAVNDGSAAGFGVDINL